METINIATDAVTNIMSGLQGINKYLAMMNSSLEILILSELPDYVIADLAKVYQAEQEASHIVKSLKLFCEKTF